MLCLDVYVQNRVTVWNTRVPYNATNSLGSNSLYSKTNRMCKISIFRLCSFVPCVKPESIRVCLLEQGLDDEIRNELGECDLSDVS